jgi:HAMP domain-containing protein
MRRQATDISASDPGRRLSLASGKDEIALLGATLNQMLDRIEESVAREWCGSIRCGSGRRSTTWSTTR